MKFKLVNEGYFSDLDLFKQELPRLLNEYEEYCKVSLKHIPHTSKYKIIPNSKTKLTLGYIRGVTKSFNKKFDCEFTIEVDNQKEIYLRVSY